jgi:7-carboxy-7-deazaguanine synthase
VKELIQLLQEKEKKIVVETQGSIWQDWFSLVDVLTISPKPPSSGMKTNWDTLDTIVTRVNEDNTSIKVVIFDNEDYLYARQVHMRYPSYPFYLQVGNDDVKESGNISSRLLKKLEWLFEKVLGDNSMNGARVLPQLHALIWNNERGK